MKIGVKLVTITSIINLIGISLLAGTTILESSREITRLVDEQAQSIAVQSSEKIKSWLNEYIDSIRTLTHVMEGYKKIPAEERRSQFDFMMSQVVLANPSLRSIYANWSPNGLDGLDADYANTPESDETGRYISAWSIADGKAVARAVQGFGWDAVMQMPTFGQEYMLDPAVYPLASGGVTLIANMGVPVKDTGETIGMIGASFELSTIQAIAQEIKPLGGGYVMMFSNGGIIAAHTDADRLGKKE